MFCCFIGQITDDEPTHDEDLTETQNQSGNFGIIHNHFGIVFQ